MTQNKKLWHISLVVLASMAIMASVGLLLAGKIVVGIIFLIWNTSTVVINAIPLYKGNGK
jgi:hypothetical protein